MSSLAHPPPPRTPSPKIRILRSRSFDASPSSLSYRSITPIDESPYSKSASALQGAYAPPALRLLPVMDGLGGGVDGKGNADVDVVMMYSSSESDSEGEEEEEGEGGSDSDAEMHSSSNSSSSPSSPKNPSSNASQYSLFRPSPSHSNLSASSPPTPSINITAAAAIPPSEWLASSSDPTILSSSVNIAIAIHAPPSALTSTSTSTSPPPLTTTSTPPPPLSGGLSGGLSPYQIHDPHSAPSSPWLVRMVLDMHDQRGVDWMMIAEPIARCWGVGTSSGEVLGILSGNGRVGGRRWWD